MKQSVLALLKRQRARKALILSAEQYFQNYKKEQEVIYGHQRLATANKH